MPRIPLPVKLFLSYLCILLLGAGPTVFYITRVLPIDTMREAARQLGERGKRLAHHLAELPAGTRLGSVKEMGQLSSDRLSYLSPQGEVLYDNEIPEGIMPDSHASRPEFRQALGDTSVGREAFAIDPMFDGVGVARRVSVTRNIDTLYVAVRVPGAGNETAAVLRLATPINRIESMSQGLVQFIRNATAVAVTAAIGFSLIAAVVFVRPLQRVRDMAAALTAGDMGAKVQRFRDDEVGDLAHALNDMATALRRKLLDAGLGEALISQLVEALPCPCVVFAEAGDVVAVNGPGRRALRIEGPLAGQHMREFAEHPAVQAAVATAELEGEPEPLTVTMADPFTVCGFLHVLKRPGTAPLRVFFGASLPETEPTLLPEPGSIMARPLVEVLELAHARCAHDLEYARLRLELPAPRPQLLIADAEERCISAVCHILQAGGRALAGSAPILRVTLLEEATRVALHIEIELTEQSAASVRALIEPLGGSVDVALMETRLWLPRA